MIQYFFVNAVDAYNVDIVAIDGKYKIENINEKGAHNSLLII